MRSRLRKCFEIYFAASENEIRTRTGSTGDDLQSLRRRKLTECAPVRRSKTVESKVRRVLCCDRIPDSRPTDTTQTQAR